MNHQEKVENIKLDVIEMKKKFEDRIADLKVQVKNNSENNDAIEELKRKLADHVRESNKKYSDLL